MTKQEMMELQEQIQSKRAQDLLYVELKRISARYAEGMLKKNSLTTRSIRLRNTLMMLLQD